MSGTGAGERDGERKEQHEEKGMKEGKKEATRVPLDTEEKLKFLSIAFIKATDETRELKANVEHLMNVIEDINFDRCRLKQIAKREREKRKYAEACSTGYKGSLPTPPPPPPPPSATV
jgi:hypothetical protein